jgi:glycerophosphoryl diester phosphodiesterase
MKIWAHRGCSQRYPENTLTAFKKAAELFEKGLVGIELDIQKTKDGKLVVIHDERVDRTTDGYGFVRDYTLDELKCFHIYTGKSESETIPTMEEVFDLLAPELEKGFKINIELKNSVYVYEGMESDIVEMVKKRGLEDNIVYSSFSARSMEIIRSLAPNARTGMLDTRVSDCLYKLRGGTGTNDLHPYGGAMDLPVEDLKDYTVRAWFTGHLFPEKPTGGRMDLEALEKLGITDVFLNEPEVYLN